MKKKLKLLLILLILVGVLVSGCIFKNKPSCEDQGDNHICREVCIFKTEVPQKKYSCQDSGTLCCVSRKT